MAELHTGTLGWFYIALTSVWTLVIIGGMVFLHHHRRLPFLRVRRLPLVFTAVALLHMFEMAAMAAWTYGPLMPCEVQFWIMSIYLPFGIAMLQAANSQFLHVATQQRKYAQFAALDEQSLSEKAKHVGTSRTWWGRAIQKMRGADKVTRILIYIGIAMLLELALTLFVYFGSEIFHPNYGIFHVQVPGIEHRLARCLTGWEWWLSIVWQFFWAWVYAPYMLWKTRNIHDTHGWRTQTILCCFAGLPASPLWLAGVYIPEMAPMNEVFVPPQWFALSIFFIEICMILWPCWQVIKTHNLKRETIDALASWEERNKAFNESIDTSSTHNTSASGKTLGTSFSSRSQRSKSSGSSRRSDMFTMVALQNALDSNPKPLLEFAALKDFSGENVSFLLQISDWKRGWAVAKSEPQLMQDQFIRAVQVYSHFISLEFSEFPINICSRQAKDLFQIFDEAARLLNRRGSHSDQVTPFDTDFPATPPVGPLPSLEKDAALETTLGVANLQSVTHMVELGGPDSLALPIPNLFAPDVFDAAEDEIKYLVLTNTWPKFVHAGLRNSSQESLESPTPPFSMAKYLCGAGDMS